MGINANPAPAETVKSSVKLASCISAILAKEAEVTLLYDKYRVTAKAEATRLGLTDRKGLTAVLYASGDTDARRISNIVAFVFPANAENRAVIDKIMETNATAKDPNKRIAKEVLLEVQKSKEPITLEKAKKIVAANKAGTRKPGGETDQTDKKKKKQNPDKVLGEMLTAALTFAKENGYDMADFQAVLETANAEVDIDEDDEKDKDE